MQEELNRAMSTLSEEVGSDVPSFDEVREKIEARYAKAKGMAELQGQSVDTRMREIEQAAANTEAQARLASMRTELGLPGAEAPLAVEAPKSEAPPTPS
jgi:phage shock protein A